MDVRIEVMVKGALVVLHLGFNRLHYLIYRRFRERTTSIRNKGLYSHCHECCLHALLQTPGQDLFNYIWLTNLVVSDPPLSIDSTLSEFTLNDLDLASFSKKLNISALHLK